MSKRQMTRDCKNNRKDYRDLSKRQNNQGKLNKKERDSFKRCNKRNNN